MTTSGSQAATNRQMADDVILNGLVEDLTLLKSSLGGDESSRKDLEAHYALRIQVLEQSLRHRELSIQERTQASEMDIKGREVGLKEQASRIEKWANPLTVGVIVAALGLVGNFANGLWSNLNQRAQLENQQVSERIKLQNDLIKEAIKSPTEEDRAKSLVFFANNRLILLDKDVVAALVKVAGTDKPVPGSSSGLAGSFALAMPISFQKSVVDNIRASPKKHIPENLPAAQAGQPNRITAIILHDAVGPDATETILKKGRPDLPGPLAHWLVKSDGAIVLIAPETSKAAHLGFAKDGLKNDNTIGVMVSGQPALASKEQLESLVRLVANISERWQIPVEKILSHAETALPMGIKIDMLQQAPLVREMVRAAKDRATQ